MLTKKPGEPVAPADVAGRPGAAAPAVAGPRRRTRTREALLLAARALMAAQARDGFTIDDVVQSAGVAKGSFYNHFPNKEALADEVYRTIRSREEGEIEAVNRAVVEPATRIARGMAVYARFALTSPDEARILTHGQMDALSIKSSMNAGLVRDLTEGLRAGTMTIPSVDVGAMLVIGQTAALLSRLNAGTGRDAAGALAQHCIAMTLLGLGLEHKAAHLVSAQAVEDILRRVHPLQTVDAARPRPS